MFELRSGLSGLNFTGALLGIPGFDMGQSPDELRLGHVGVIQHTHVLSANYMPGTGLHSRDGCRGQKPLVPALKDLCSQERWAE